ncbi:MAG: hypothetical protein M1826_005629 [Phylliscum demangeonii]|nr:MAG: hypothetical protein M1826_005629 [Phylliscum demangeonii]
MSCFVQISPVKAGCKGIGRAKTPSPTKSTLVNAAYLTSSKRTPSLINELDTPTNRPHTEQDDQVSLLQPTKAGTSEPYLIIHFPSENDLPPKPWPLSPTGAPLLITSKPMFSSVIDMGRTGQNRKSLIIQSSLEMGEEPSLDALNEIVQEHKRRYMYDIAELPPLINRVMVTYKLNAGTKSEAARRSQEPSLAIPDDTDYGKQLRPGSPSGARYITVASDGFPQPQAVVYHPNGGGKRIGQVEQVLEGTDISLANLDEGIEFSCQPFGLELARPGPLTGLRSHEKVRQYDYLYFDSPFSGYSEAMVIAKYFQRIPIDGDDPENRWIHGHITHTSIGGL